MFDKYIKRGYSFDALEIPGDLCPSMFEYAVSRLGLKGNSDVTLVVSPSEFPPGSVLVTAHKVDIEFNFNLNDTWGVVNNDLKKIVYSRGA